MPKLLHENRYILTNIQNNNNKWWNAQLYDDGTVVTEWGRIGEVGRSKTFPSAGEHSFLLRCQDKERSGYRVLRVAQNDAPSRIPKSIVPQVAQEQITCSDTAATQLIARLAQANIHSILSATTLQYDESRGVFETPFGTVTREAVSEARQLLTQMGEFVEREEYEDQYFATLVSEYLMLIPQDIGRARANLRELYPNIQALQKQNALLESVEASLPNEETIPKKEQESPVEKVFDVSVKRVEDRKTLRYLNNKFNATYQRSHASSHLKIQSVYEVHIASMHKAFEERGRPLGNVRELWHGTRVANLLSILQSGLRVSPPTSTQITGKMFGNGIYASDQSTKALNYSYGYWSGERENNCFLLLIDMAMGKCYTPQSYIEALPKPGYDSTFARSGYSGVMNNEMIAPHDWQVNIKYLVEFDSK
jgi:poly [ADP-ribose] polymerase